MVKLVSLLENMPMDLTLNSPPTQPQYRFSKNEFGEESTTLIELAYALTVHKAQGSGSKRFSCTPNPNRCYQGITLHRLTNKDKVIIPIKAPMDLKKYSADFYPKPLRDSPTCFFNPTHRN